MTQVTPLGNRLFLSRGLQVVSALLVVATVTPVLRRPQNFLADDAYFYLEIGRRLAAGQGSTFNGITPTNGYHPLWTLVCAGLSLAAGGDKPLVLAGTILLHTVLVLGAAWLLASTLARHGVRSWAVGLPLLGLFFLTGVFGSEAALNAFVLTLALWCLGRTTGEPSPRRAVGFGLVLGAAVLTRLDNLIVTCALLPLVAVPGTGLAPGASGRRWAVRHGLLAALALLAVLGPYFLLNLTLWGHPLPVSVMIKSTFPVPGWRPHQLGTLGRLVLAGNLGAALLAALPLWEERHRGLRLGLAAVSAATVGQVAYILVFLHGMAWSWYFVPGVLTIAAALAAVYDRLASGAPRLRRLSAIPAAIAILLAVLTPLRGWARYADPHLVGFRTEWLSGHRPPATRWQILMARWLGRALPPGTRIAVDDGAGMVTWYSDLPTIGLDGLVADIEFGDRLAAESPLGYLRHRHVRAYVGPVTSAGDQSRVLVRPVGGRPAGALVLRRAQLVGTMQFPGGPEWGLWDLARDAGADDPARTR